MSETKTKHALATEIMEFAVSVCEANPHGQVIEAMTECLIAAVRAASQSNVQQALILSQQARRIEEVSIALIS